MTIDFPDGRPGPIDENALPDDREARAQGSLDAVQALIDREQEGRLSERACDWARRGDRRAETSRHALRFVLMEKLADDLVAVGGGSLKRAK